MDDFNGQYQVAEDAFEAVSSVYKFVHTPKVRKNVILKIMIIDDQKKDIDLFEELLRTESNLAFQLNKYTRFSEAMRFLSTNHEDAAMPDIIILDINMPEMNGLQVLDKLKTLKGLKELPIIIYSSSCNSNNVISTYDKQAAAFFEKPLNTDEFVKYIGFLRPQFINLTVPFLPIFSNKTYARKNEL